jgi:hypothetical protein
VKIPLVGPTGLGRITANNSRRAVNFYLESDESGGKEKVYWVGTPGLKLWVTPAASVRGWLNWADTYLYFVAGDKLYRADTSGTISASLGTLSTSSGIVDLKRNRTQVLITDGSLGQYYVYDTVHSSFVAVSKWSTVTTINTATRSGVTVTINATAHGGETGDTAKVWGTDKPGYRTVADVSITKTGANTFTYPLTIANLTPIEIASITRSGLTATVTTDENHGLASSDDTIIAGAAASEWNGAPNITVTGDKTFTFPYSLTTINVVSIINSPAGTATCTTDGAHGYTSGRDAFFASTNASYNGTRTSITVTAPTTFTFSCAAGAADDNPSSGTVGQLPVDEATTAAQVGRLPDSPDGGVDGLAAVRTDALTIQPERCAQMDGYGILQNSVTNTTEGIHPGQWYTTYPDDFTTVRASSLGVAQRDPDDMLVPAAPEAGGHLYLIGRDSTEVWGNPGNSEEVPFEPIRTAAIPWGCLAPWSVQPLGDGLAWLGKQKRGGITVFMLESGYKPTDISSPAIAKWLEGSTLSDLQNATAISWKEFRHDFYALTVGTETKLYDHAESSRLGFPCWSDWTSYNGSSYVQSRAKFHVFFAKKHLVADHTNAKILEMDYATYTDLDGSTARAIQRLGVSGYVFSEDKGVSYSRIFVDMEPAGASGTLLLESSDDKGETWVAHETKSFLATATRLEWFGLGLARTDRLFRLTTTSAAKIVILGMTTDPEASSA